MRGCEGEVLRGCGKLINPRAYIDAMQIPKTAAELLENSWIYIAEDAPLFGGTVYVYSTNKKSIRFVRSYSRATAGSNVLERIRMVVKGDTAKSEYSRIREGLLSTGRYDMHRELTPDREGLNSVGELSNLETFNFKQCGLASIVTLVRILILISRKAKIINIDTSPARTDRYKESQSNVYEQLGFEKPSEKRQTSSYGITLSYCIPELFRQFTSKTSVKQIILDSINKKPVRATNVLKAAEGFALAVLKEAAKRPQSAEMEDTKEKAQQILWYVEYFKRMFLHRKVIQTDWISKQGEKECECKG